MKVYGAKNMPAMLLLSQVLAREYGLRSLPELRKTALGKPYFPSFPGLHFNLSHSGSWVLCAVSQAPVGVDIEGIRPRGPSLPRYALSEKEYAQFRRMGEDWPAFYSLWTRKEAWCKYTGQGLKRQWKEDPPEEGLYYGAYGDQLWRAAVCGEEPAPKDIIWWEGSI